MAVAVFTHTASLVTAAVDSRRHPRSFTATFVLIVDTAVSAASSGTLCDCLQLPRVPLMPQRQTSATFDRMSLTNVARVLSVMLTLSPPISLRLYTLPYWSNPPFLISDIWALWRSGLSARVPKCQKLKMAG